MGHYGRLRCRACRHFLLLLVSIFYVKIPISTRSATANPFEHAGEHTRTCARDRVTRVRSSGMRISTSSTRCCSTTRCHEQGALLCVHCHVAHAHAARFHLSWSRVAGCGCQIELGCRRRGWRRKRQKSRMAYCRRFAVRCSLRSKASEVCEMRTCAIARACSAGCCRVSLTILLRRSHGCGDGMILQFNAYIAQDSAQKRSARRIYPYM